MLSHEKVAKTPSSSSESESESMDTSKSSTIVDSPQKAQKGKRKEQKGAAKNSSSDSDSESERRTQAERFASILLRMEKRLDEKERENRELKKLMPPPASPASPAAATASPAPKGKGQAAAQPSPQRGASMNPEELEKKSAGQLSVEDLQYLLEQREARQKPVKRPSDSPPQSSSKLTKMQPNILLPYQGKPWKRVELEDV
jgi:hypothetical protein